MHCIQCLYSSLNASSQASNTKLPEWKTMGMFHHGMGMGMELGGRRRLADAKPVQDASQWPIQGEWRGFGKALPWCGKEWLPTAAHSQTWIHLRLQWPNCLDPCTLMPGTLAVLQKAHISPSLLPCCFPYGYCLDPPFFCFTSRSSSSSFQTLLHRSQMQQFTEECRRFQKTTNYHRTWILFSKGPKDQLLLLLLLLLLRVIIAGYTLFQ